MSDVEQGGDPACWAHLFEDDGVVAADLDSLLGASGDGVHWTLEPESDLNANLVRLEPGHVVGEHTNEEVDVLLVVLAGRGHVVLDTATLTLTPNVVVHLPKGARRAIHATGEGVTYLTVHRRRGGLSIGRR